MSGQRDHQCRVHPEGAGPNWSGAEDAKWWTIRRMSDELKNAAVSVLTGGPGGAVLGFLLWPVMKTTCRHPVTGDYTVDCVPIVAQDITSPWAMGTVGAVVGFVIAFVISEVRTSD